MPSGDREDHAGLGRRTFLTGLGAGTAVFGLAPGPALAAPLTEKEKLARIVASPKNRPSHYHSNKFGSSEIAWGGSGTSGVPGQNSLHLFDQPPFLSRTPSLSLRNLS
jgi:hypothetical protein